MCFIRHSQFPDDVNQPEKLTQAPLRVASEQPRINAKFSTKVYDLSKRPGDLHGHGCSATNSGDCLQPTSWSVSEMAWPLHSSLQDPASNL